MKKKEVHVFIVWSKGLVHREKIIVDIETKFEIIECINTTWTKRKFSENLSRFYGENLPKNSFKEKHCGAGTFLCIIVIDNNPKYDLRNTSKGVKVVNINLFDAKQLYREWTGGGHKIHATDNVNEAKQNLYLLYGRKYKDILNETPFKLTKNYNQDLIGSRGWKSLSEVFEALNELSNYLVLRNFENIDSELDNLHPDIDILTDDDLLLANIINGKKTFKQEYRVQYLTIINNKSVYFDLRYLGDGYYDNNWEQHILYNRVKYQNIYIPNEENHFYTLIYHAFIHKRGLSEDYVLKLIKLSKTINLNYTLCSFVDNKLLEDLNLFMSNKNYNYIEPNDLSVYFNIQIIKKFKSVINSKSRCWRDFKNKVKNKLKSAILKILHFTFNQSN